MQGPRAVAHSANEVAEKQFSETPASPADNTDFFCWCHECRGLKHHSDTSSDQTQAVPMDVDEIANQLQAVSMEDQEVPNQPQAVSMDEHDPEVVDWDHTIVARVARGARRARGTGNN